MARANGPPQRRVSSRAVRLELLVFAEGRRTEVMYLTEWHRRHRDRVLVTIDPFHGEPLSLVERAVEAQREEAREARRGRGRAHDEVWCVFDRDVHPNIPEAMALAGRHGIQVAFSNPCLELWFLLHFENRTTFIERHEAQRRSEAFLGCSKTLSTRALDMLLDGYDVAKARAISLDERHAGDGSPPGSNPGSSVWRLVDRIREAPAGSSAREGA